MTDFYELRIKAGYPSRIDAAQLCGVTPRTIRNWEKNGAPKTATSLIQLSAGSLDWAGPPMARLAIPSWPPHHARTRQHYRRGHPGNSISQAKHSLPAKPLSTKTPGSCPGFFFVTRYIIQRSP